MLGWGKKYPEIPLEAHEHTFGTRVLTWFLSDKRHPVLAQVKKKKASTLLIAADGSSSLFLLSNVFVVNN